MKILHITDSHGTVKAPESRQDVYYISFLRKLYEVGMTVKAYGIDMVIHTGDLFHTARVSDKFTGQVAELIKATNVPFYVVPGNHDIEGYTTDTIDQTKLGLLAKTGVIKLLDRDNPVVLTCKQGNEEYTVGISGQEYYTHIDEGNMQDFEMQQDPCDLNILAIHGYISDIAQHPDVKHTLCQDIITDADIILTGHYHREFDWSDGQNLDIFNPGSMMRVDQTEYNKTHMPKYGILDIRLDNQGCVVWDYTFHQFKTARPSTEVFDYSSKYKAKHASITLEGFKTSLANTMPQVNANTTNIVSIIQNICKGAGVDPKVEKKALDIYNLTLQSIPDEFEAPMGFIESPKYKKIERVEIKNFQSHANTTVVFDKGLNIIVGESNNGKTSILRAIMWAIDNQPLGNDFIMAGQDECRVTIVYDDGTFIARGRTVKDTGYYKVGYFDENGKMQTAEYRGFTNAIPVEVVNTHQMPKVNITKDIETHLNVSSQLDSPFLITESPMSKAAAIGRITGTHILDAGVKENNKTIQGNKKTIKVHNSSLVEKDNELRQLPDIALMDKVGIAYKAIVSAIKTRYALIDSIQRIQKSMVDSNNQILAWTQEVQAKRNISRLLPTVQQAQSKKQRIDSISTKMYKCNELNILCRETERIVDVNRQIAALKPIVISTLSRVDAYADIKQKRWQAMDLIVSANKHHARSMLMRYYIDSINAIYTHCSLSLGFVNKVAPKMQSYDFCLDAQVDATGNLSSAKKMVKATKMMITKTSKERSQFVLDNGICPCCGQLVSDASHSDSIINFFADNNIGG